jgi:hypothetical protein
MKVMKKQNIHRYELQKNTLYEIDKLKIDIESLQSKNDTLSTLKQIVPEFEHKPHKEGN